eukprot:COSAG02_NODE_12590_length_1522_cov_1.115249_3_plen_75_part_00
MEMNMMMVVVMTTWCYVCVGENNGQNPGNAGLKQGYACLLPQMIKSWRREFSSRGASDPDFPFGVVRSTLLLEW